MRIIVFSDTHGNYSAMHKIFKRNGDADLFIFLGDGERDLDSLRVQYLDKKIVNVSGNCDFASLTPENDIYMTDNGIKIFYKAKEIGAQIALFGHTHCRYYAYEEGIHILNPGSAGQPRDGKPASYAYIDITKDGGIFCSHVDL